MGALAALCESVSEHRAHSCTAWLQNEICWMTMFENFRLERIDCGEATLRVRYGGTGPPLLSLHGHPQTHFMWHRVAPRLADEFTVVPTGDIHRAARLFRGITTNGRVIALRLS